MDDFLIKEFNGDPNNIVNSFIEYVKFLKTKQDVKVSITEIEKGEFVDIDEVLNNLNNKYANQ